jgi:serine/threonine-protein kinase
VLLAAAGTLARRRRPAAGAEPSHPDRLVGPVPPAGGSSTGQARQIGRYTVVRQIGSGGMAEVLLARATGEAGFERLVALKVLHRQQAAQQEFVDHFLDEARLAAQLNHPNVVQVTDLGRADGEYFLAMEYIDGSDLDRLLLGARSRGAAVPLRVALAILGKVADGLHAAHVALGTDGKPLDIVHRDVKASNVFVARNGTVKIGDFGIAKARQESRIHRTEVGKVKGTAAYMAPEHRVGEPVDARADVYGLGALAYELFSGQLINLDLALLAHLGRQGWPHLRPLVEVRPDLPPELGKMVWQALSYAREDRYPSCRAVAEALDVVVIGYGLAASDRVVAEWVEAELAATPEVFTAADDITADPPSLASHKQ